MESTLTIENWSVENVQPYDKDPRINEKAIEPVARSLGEFGFRQPLVVDAEGVLIVGHTRLLAAKSIGMTEVPVHVATDLTEAQIRAYRIAEIAEWDDDLLPIELGELRDMEFDLDLIGFSTAEIAKLVEPDITDGLTEPDQVPEPPDEAITQPGDL